MSLLCAMTLFTGLVREDGKPMKHDELYGYRVLNVDRGHVAKRFTRLRIGNRVLVSSAILHVPDDKSVQMTAIDTDGRESTKPSTIQFRLGYQSVGAKVVRCVPDYLWSV